MASGLKDRTTDDMVNWAKQSMALGERLREVRHRPEREERHGCLGLRERRPEEADGIAGGDRDRVEGDPIGVPGAGPPVGREGAAALDRIRRARRDGRDHAVDPGDPDAHGDQREHVQVAGDQRLGPALEERPTGPEHHRRAQHELNP